MLKTFFKRIIVFILTLEARLVLKRYRPRIIAVTGSVGKTSTKDAIYELIARREFVRKSEKSFNSEIGVPLTILGRPNAWNDPLGWLENIGFGLLTILRREDYPRWLVLEVGADRPGDIRSIAKWLHPDIVVVTRFAPVPVHIEFFGTRERVIEEKSYLVKSLKSDGVLVLCQDDPDVYALKALVANESITFGFSRSSTIWASKDSVVYEGRGEKRRAVGSAVRVSYGEESVMLSVRKSVGRQMLYASLAATAVGRALNMKLLDIAETLSGLEGPLGRMHLLEGINGSLVIDDTYNSSPVAAREGLDALAGLTNKGRKIAVLGDMLELGKFSVTEHKEIGKYAAEKVSLLATVGVRSRDTAAGALEKGMSALNVLKFDEPAAAGKALAKLLQPGDVILVKGSQGIRCERVVEELMAHPEEKSRFLVRQESEWANR